MTSRMRHKDKYITTFLSSRGVGRRSDLLIFADGRRLPAFPDLNTCNGADRLLRQPADHPPVTSKIIDKVRAGNDKDIVVVQTFLSVLLQTGMSAVRLYINSNTTLFRVPQLRGVLKLKWISKIILSVPHFYRT